MQRIPQIWPGWQADELIGQGSYGRVYRASRTIAGHTSSAAVKIIDIPRDDEEVEALRAMNMDALSIRSYFEQTARSVVDEVVVMDSLKGSAHVVHIEDYQLVEREDGVGWSVFIRMELLEALPDYQRKHGMPDTREVARIGLEIADALQSCHERNIIHRDVKPANVFRSAFGTYRLGDFGIAKRLDEATRSTKSFAGTEAFMAPEIPSGHYDERVDIYSLGIMLYRWLNGGRPPFLSPTGTVTQADLERARLKQLSGERPPLPAGADVDPALASLVRRAIEPKPEDRWPSAAALKSALQAWLDGRGETMSEAEATAAPGVTIPFPQAAGATESSFRTVDARAAFDEVAEGIKPQRGSDVAIDLSCSASEAAQGATKKVTYRLPSTGESVSLNLRIPAGTAEGARIRAKGMGDYGTAGGERGNLIVHVTVMPARASQPATAAATSPVPSQLDIVRPQTAESKALDEKTVREVKRQRIALTCLKAMVIFYLVFSFAALGPVFGAVMTGAIGCYILIWWVLAGRFLELKPGTFEGEAYVNKRFGLRITPKAALQLRKELDTVSESGQQTVRYRGTDAQGKPCYLQLCTIAHEGNTAKTPMEAHLARQIALTGADPLTRTEVKNPGKPLLTWGQLKFLARTTDVSRTQAKPHVQVTEYVAKTYRQIVTLTLVTTDGATGAKTQKELLSCLGRA